MEGPTAHQNHIRDPLGAEVLRPRALQPRGRCFTPVQVVDIVRGNPNERPRESRYDVLVPPGAHDGDRVPEFAQMPREEDQNAIETETETEPLAADEYTQSRLGLT